MALTSAPNGDNWRQPTSNTTTSSQEKVPTLKQSRSSSNLLIRRGSPVTNTPPPQINNVTAGATPPPNIRNVVRRRSSSTDEEKRHSRLSLAGVRRLIPFQLGSSTTTTEKQRALSKHSSIEEPLAVRNKVKRSPTSYLRSVNMRKISADNHHHQQQIRANTPRRPMSIAVSSEAVKALSQSLAAGEPGLVRSFDDGLTTTPRSAMTPPPQVKNATNKNQLHIRKQKSSVDYQGGGGAVQMRTRRNELTTSEAKSRRRSLPFAVASSTGLTAFRNIFSGGGKTPQSKPKGDVSPLSDHGKVRRTGMQRLGDSIASTVTGGRHRAVRQNSITSTTSSTTSTSSAEMRRKQMAANGRRCDATLTLKTARKESGSGVLCESCPSQDESTSATDTAKNDDLFNLLEKMQGTRMDEQRCSFHVAAVANQQQLQQQESGSVQGVNGVHQYPSIDDVIKSEKPHPQIIPPSGGGYWIEGFTLRSPHLKSPDEDFEGVYAPPCELFLEETKSAYREHFLGTEHLNFSARDNIEKERIGCILMSVKFENTPKDEKVVVKEGGSMEKIKDKTCGKCRVILRCQEDSWTKCFPINSESGGLVQWAKDLCPDMNIDCFQPINAPNTWQSLLHFDEHSIQPSSKFGLLFQRGGQTKEEQVFSNQGETEAFTEFLDFLGDRVKLQGFAGFRGGLDVYHGHTGDKSLYTNFRGREVMFHVSTLLPYVEGDRQQLQRKRHIGNDVVAIVFQNENTPFVPNMITTRFLHAYIVIQPIAPNTDNVRYKVSVTGRSDVPTFGPELPEPAVFKKDDAFRNWLYCKLINAETFCYKSEKFAGMQLRTRSMLMMQLHSELREGTNLLLDSSNNNTDNVSLSSISSETVGTGSRETSTTFFETFKKLAKRRRNSEDSNASPTISHSKVEKSDSKSSTDGKPATGGSSGSVSNEKSAGSSPVHQHHNGTDDVTKNLEANENSNNGKSLAVTAASSKQSLNSLNGSLKKITSSSTRNVGSPCRSLGSFNSLDSDTGLESCASSSRTDSLPSSSSGGGKSTNHPSGGADEKINEEDIRKNEIEELQRLREEHQRQQKELINLRNEVRRLKGASPLLRRRPTDDDVTATTKEHLV